MSTDQTKNYSISRLGGIAGLITLLFLPGVGLQMSSGWYPEKNLEAGTMADWLQTVSANSFPALLGVAFSIIAIICFIPLSLNLYRQLPKEGWWSTAALIGHLLGTGLALAAFTFGFGFTWAVLDLVRANPGSTEQLVPVATLGLRGYLTADDLATALIGSGHLLYSLAALRAQQMPKWLGWMGMLAGILVILVLLRYFAPIFAVASIGYPLLVIWFVANGALLLRRTDPVPAIA